MIDSFRKEYGFLSNFYPVTIVYEDIKYPSVENAYQAAKTFDMDLRMEMSEMTASEAKKEGNRLKKEGLIRPDWEEINIDLMYELLKLKFSSAALQWKLLQTVGNILVEGNTWHDNFWGSCICDNCGDKGLNYLGKLLMKVRNEIT